MVTPPRVRRRGVVDRGGWRRIDEGGGLALLVNTPPPRPTLPDYAGPNVRGIIPALLMPRRAALPPWVPAVVTGATQVVLLVLDGLGWEQLQSHRDLCPTLTSMMGGPITTRA